MRHCKLKELTFGIQIGLFNKLSKEAKEEKMKKYKILEDGSIKFRGKSLCRIQALIDFADVKAGDIGGYVESENNLSHEGEAWVYDNAIVCDDARVFHNAKVYWDAKVFDHAKVYYEAKIHGSAEIYGNAEVYGEVKIYGSAKISIREDYIVFKNSWSSGRYFTYTRSNKMWQVGCFYGTGEELVKKAYEDSELSGKNYSLYVELVKNLEKP